MTNETVTKERTLLEIIAMAGQSAAGSEIQQELLDLCVDFLPSGSGFDNGTQIMSASWDKIVLQTSFHHMNEVGMYTEWTEHKVTVTPSFGPGEFNIKVSGRNVNDIKNYIDQVFYNALRQKVRQTFHHDTRRFTLELA